MDKEFEEMMKKQEERQELEAELRCLQSDLQHNTSDCGDWRMAKAMEKLIVGLQDCEAENVGKFVKDWASDTYNSIGGDIQNRVEKRKRVNEIEEALKEI